MTDDLTTLQNLIGEIRQHVIETNTAIRNMRRENEMLREALQAFVDIPSPSDLADENSAVGVVVTLAQFRAAVAALAKAKGQSDDGI